MPVIDRPAQPTHELPGARFISLATPSRGSSDTAVWEVRIAPGHPGTVHQLTREEVFVVLDGAGIARLDGADHAVAAGSVIVVPSRADFCLEADGADDLVALCCLPVGGQGVIGGGEPFTPPWAE
jgi:mannose-6-phosphate isomerase-like protein (cupin superfamily)